MNVIGDLKAVDFNRKAVDLDKKTVDRNRIAVIVDLNAVAIDMNHVVSDMNSVGSDMIRVDRDIIEIMTSDRTSAIRGLSQRFADLQKRLAEVESERAALKREIQEVQEQLVAAVPPPFGTSTRAQVLWALRRDPEHAHSPLDICQTLGTIRHGDLNAVRLVLGRLKRAGIVTRVAHGRYRINAAV